MRTILAMLGAGLFLAGSTAVGVAIGFHHFIAPQSDAVAPPPAAQPAAAAPQVAETPRPDLVPVPAAPKQDPKVAEASYLEDATDGGASSGPGLEQPVAIKLVRIESLHQDPPLKWSGAALDERVVLPPGDVRLVFETKAESYSEVEKQLGLEGWKTPEGVNWEPGSSDPEKWLRLESTDLEAGTHTLTIKTGGTPPYQTVWFVVPESGRGARPIVQYWADNPLAETTDASDLLDIYGGYLRLEGRSANAARPTALWWMAFDKTTGKYLTHGPVGSFASTSAGHWMATVQMADVDLDAEGNLYLYAVDGRLEWGEYAFSKPFSFRNHAGDSLSEPSIVRLSRTISGSDGPSDLFFTSDGIYLAGTKTLTATISASNASRAHLFVKVDGPRNAVISGTVDNDGTATITIPDLAPWDGIYRLRAVLAQGPHMVESEVVSIRVRDDGPKVDRVNDEAFRVIPAETTLVIQFDRDHPLDETSIRDTGDFTLVNKSTSPAQTAALGLDDIKFDRITNSITVKFGQEAVAPGQYLLTIKDVKDLYGVTMPIPAQFPIAKLVGGPLGDPVPLGERAGLSSIGTGPYISFPEYTEPRKYPDGFNPSDKVVTRIARLYYFRDAHRVAQIVNRKSRSYNRQGADMQRQLADQARGRAEDLIDKRKSLEIAAVRSAQDARRAEEALTTFQQALVQARDQSVELDRQIAAAEAELFRVRQERADVRDIRVRTEAVETQYTGAGERLGALKLRQTQLKAESSDITEDLAATEPAPTEEQRIRLQARAQHITAELNHIENIDIPAAERAAAMSTTMSGYETTDVLREADQVIAKRQRELDFLRAQRQRAIDQIEIQEQRINAALGEVQAARTAEIAATQEWEEAIAVEERAVADQFRREVAAAKADPDTYAPADPKSDDPVEQVSISVIGEGVIQLRGPLKGVNIVRTMINEIDAPVGQVRIALHTIQVNGERGDRMEPVIMRIQRYVDHSRFLSVRSAQMLRNAVVRVAAQQAEAARLECPPGTSQAERDRKYMEAFFGGDFIAELHELDSEFLHSGNKLLSLHSMDSTSLASALFLFALAKNSVRMQILHQFQADVEGRLPEEELEYFTASGAELSFGPPFCKEEFQFFGHQARFVSLRGFFDAEIVGDDTLTPIQREFVKLAQILKSRLVTEIELQERVMERALIESRVGNYREELEEAKKVEDRAENALVEQQAILRKQQAVVANTMQIVAGHIAILRDAEQETNRSAVVFSQKFPSGSEAFLEQLKREHSSDWGSALPEGLTSQQTLLARIDASIQQSLPALQSAIRKGNPQEVYEIVDMIFRTNVRIVNELAGMDIPVDEGALVAIPMEGRVIGFIIMKDDANGGYKAEIANPDDAQHALKTIGNAFAQVEQIAAVLDQFEPSPRVASFQQRAVQLRREIEASKNDEKQILDNLVRIAGINALTAEAVPIILSELEQLEIRLKSILAHLVRPQEPMAVIYESWLNVQRDILDQVRGDLASEAQDVIATADEAFRIMLLSELQLRFAEEQATDSRLPLDHRKFLDMLIDDTEDKYIELLEGTRAHTANIDNYIGRIATAFEDDLNTQFYHPAFRAIRETGRFWDVSFGQIETTNILANNRSFAKVTPQATMEFDLPKRDILITEAFESAAAVYTEYGALMADPNFLALTKMYSGQPTASVHGTGFPNPVVRDVLPGLPGAVDEQFLIQADAAAPDFASPLEALIPDPAIYKFETGTGFEIRPVIQPDGQAVVFHLNYMYTTNVREPVAADEKHLGRVKRHFIDTDVQLANYELREVSRYQVALKASRTARGVPLLEDVPGLGVLFRPLPQDESSLQENIILAQATIFPTLFDLMGLRFAPAVADLDSLSLRELEFVVRSRRKALRNEVFDYSSHKVDEFLRIPPGERRPDLYRTQETIPDVHPNGYRGPGLGRIDSELREGHDPRWTRPETSFAPKASQEWLPPGPPAGAVPVRPTLPPGAVPLRPPSPPEAAVPLRPAVPSGPALLPKQSSRSPSEIRPLTATAHANQSLGRPALSRNWSSRRPSTETAQRLRGTGDREPFRADPVAKAMIRRNPTIQQASFEQSAGKQAGREKVELGHPLAEEEAVNPAAPRSRSFWPFVIPKR